MHVPMNTAFAPLLRLPKRQPLLFLLLAAVAWFGLYLTLSPASEALVAALPVERDSHLGGALQFFLYDTPKVLLLLTGIVFVMGMINSYFTPERTRSMLAGRTEGAANVMAASLGVVTPFCSCSAVPLFIGFVQAGVPLGVTFSEDAEVFGHVAKKKKKPMLPLFGERLGDGPGQCRFQRSRIVGGRSQRFVAASLHAYFRGQCVTLNPGNYPSLGVMGLNNSVSSLREIGWNAGGGGPGPGGGGFIGSIALYESPGNDLAGLSPSTSRRPT